MHVASVCGGCVWLELRGWCHVAGACGWYFKYSPIRYFTYPPNSCTHGACLSRGRRQSCRGPVSPRGCRLFHALLIPDAVTTISSPSFIKEVRFSFVMCGPSVQRQSISPNEADSKRALASAARHGRGARRRQLSKTKLFSAEDEVGEGGRHFRPQMARPGFWPPQSRPAGKAVSSTTRSHGLGHDRLVARKAVAGGLAVTRRRTPV